MCVGLSPLRLGHGIARGLEILICPRCAFDSIEQLHTSPVPGVWEVLQCQQCLYCWRTTEPVRRTDRSAYPEEFKMTADDIANAPEVPAIPPLLPKRGS